MLMTYLNPMLERRREQELLAAMYRGGLRADRQRRVTGLANRDPRVMVEHYTAVARLTGMFERVAVNKELRAS